MYRLIWIFRNGHEWDMTFKDYDEAQAYAESIGLLNNLDVDYCEIREGSLGEILLDRRAA